MGVSLDNIHPFPLLSFLLNDPGICGIPMAYGLVFHSYKKGAQLSKIPFLC